MAVHRLGREVGSEAGEDRPRRFKILKSRLVLPQRMPHLSQATMRSAPAGFDFRGVALQRGELLEERQGALQQPLAQPMEVGSLQVRFVGHRSQERLDRLVGEGEVDLGPLLGQLFRFQGGIFGIALLPCLHGVALRLL